MPEQPEGNDAVKTRLSAEVDPQDLADFAIIGASKIAKGTIQFGQWSAEMMQEFGEAIRPHLAAVYQAAHDHLQAVTKNSPHGPLPNAAAIEAARPGAARTDAARMEEKYRQAGEPAVVPRQDGRGGGEVSSSEGGMTSKRTRILWLGVATAVLAFIFPPFHFRGAGGHSTGFHFIFHPGYTAGDVDVTLLFIEMAIIGAATWAALQTQKH